MFENLFVTGGNEGGVEAPNAGIELTLMDTSLPPFVFFTNQVEMIMHVWSQTASVRTTALQVRNTIWYICNRVIFCNFILE